MSGKLYLVGTPIGNLGDFSPRAVETLQEADFIAAEDTRVTLKLLNHFGIKKPMVSYFEHNKYASGAKIFERIASGELDKGSQSFIDWWAKSIHDMVNAHLVSPDYLDAQAVTVTLEKNSGGSFAFSGTSLADVDALIVSYPA